MENQKSLPTLKQLVKGNYVHLDSYRDGLFYFTVTHYTGEFNRIGFMGGAEMDVEVKNTYQFLVPLNDIKGTTVKTNDKAIYYMRWIKKGLQDGTLIKIRG